MNPALSKSLGRIIILAAVCLLFAGALSYRFYVIQITRHAELYQKATKSYTASSEEVRQRGKIFDRDGNLLVGNMPKVYMICSPYSVVNEPFIHLEKSLRPGDREKMPRLQEARRRKVAAVLASVFGRSEEEFYAELAPMREIKAADGSVKTVKNQHLVIAKAADGGAVARFKAEMEARDLHLGGFKFEDIYIRHYPKGPMLANIIGYANIGKDLNSELGGLEFHLGEYLRPRNRSTTIERGRGGTTLSYGVTAVEEGYDGDDIYLTISEPVQAILEEELDRVAAETGARQIYAVIVDPRSGDILAMSQRPNFDLRDISSVAKGSFANALAGNAYEPGSVMKPFTVAKALDEGVITPASIIDCGNYSQWRYGGHTLTDPRGYGEMTPGGVLQKSSNIGTAKIALMMGDAMVWQMLNDFKFGTRTGLPFKPESRGRLPRYPFQDMVTVTRAAIGYAEQVTPLQLARGYCAIANGGYMPQLRLLDRCRDGKNGKISKFPSPPPEKILNRKETFAELTEMLISVTAPSGGTGRRARIPGYEVAGKTGTSQMVINGAYSKEWYRASFCGFVPARRPELVMVITVEGLPRDKEHGGGNVAAPVFQRTMSRVLRLLNVRPDHPEELKKVSLEER